VFAMAIPYVECKVFPDFIKMLQQQRHTGMDCWYPDYMDVMFTSLPWHLDSGNPCRTTSLLH